MPDQRPLRVISIPASDSVFAEHVNDVMRTERPASPDELAARLRRTHPRARARRRDLVGETEELWYVFREAPYSLPAPVDWWRSTKVARVAVTFGGKAVEASEELLRLLGVDRENLIGSHYSKFVPSEGLADAAAFLAIVIRRRSGASRVTLLRADGSRVEVEWHAEVRGRRLHAWFREV